MNYRKEYQILRDQLSTLKYSIK